MDDTLLGNRAVRDRLWRAARQGRLHHCLLFEGPEGVGKHRTALRFAQEINCTGELPPCGACTSCRLYRAGTHPDLLEVGPDPERATVVITVAQAQGVIRSLQLKAHSATHRIVIIDPVDAFNEESANTLLKTLEEPPRDTRFILITSRPAALLPTIRSRAQRVRFGAVPMPELRAWLVAQGRDPDLAEMSGGSPGLAVRLGEGEGAARREIAAALLAVVGQPLLASQTFAEAWGKKEEGQRGRADAAVDAVEELVRDIGLAAGRRTVPGDPDRARRITRWAEVVYPHGAARMADHIAIARTRLRLNVNGRVVLEALLAHLNLELRYAVAAESR